MSAPHTAYIAGLIERKRVEPDQPECVASGQCVMAAAEVFDQREVVRFGRW
ncbi:ferredoxin [Saccharothrix deserti]|uniref:ferredoxin n=1 Tax=Saccharothrix deserti TaxID=2593674 RepID=UPI001390F782|nr:hypothetical protein [Saccharothrix deserti]